MNLLFCMGARGEAEFLVSNCPIKLLGYIFCSSYANWDWITISTNFFSEASVCLVEALCYCKWSPLPPKKANLVVNFGVT